MILCKAESVPIVMSVPQKSLSMEPTIPTMWRAEYFWTASASIKPGRSGSWDWTCSSSVSRFQQWFRQVTLTACCQNTTGWEKAELRKKKKNSAVLNYKLANTMYFEIKPGLFNCQYFLVVKFHIFGQLSNYSRAQPGQCNNKTPCSSCRVFSRVSTFLNLKQRKGLFSLSTLLHQLP